MWPDASVDLFFYVWQIVVAAGENMRRGMRFLRRLTIQNRVSFAIFALQIDVRRAVLGYVVTLMMNLSTIGPL